MRNQSHDLALLDRRVADLRHCIEDAQQDGNRAWTSWERVRVLALLATTLKAMEAQKAALERDGRHPSSV